MYICSQKNSAVLCASERGRQVKDLAQYGRIPICIGERRRKWRPYSALRKKELNARVEP